MVESDAEVRKHGDQKGLETPVVHAVNDECSMFYRMFFNRVGKL